MQEKLDQLKQQFLEINDLHHTAALLYWDQSTYMPPGGAEARARQTAMIMRMAHEKLTSDETGKLLDELLEYEQSQPYDSDEASLIRIARRQYEQVANVPADFVSEITALHAESYQVWAKARPQNDFQMVLPYLEKNLELSQKWANYFPGYDHIVDPLINRSDYGMKAASIQAIFAELRKELVPLVKTIAEQPSLDNSCLHQYFPEEKQREFGLKVIKSYGYDFERGRQDKTHHPFMIKFSLGDVRITTRFNENDLGDGLFSTLHESGHAMYEQGINRAFDGTPLANGASSGVHESQSRMWENLVGRSYPFWKYYYPQLLELFPEQLNAVSLDTFYRAINKVEPSLIRVDADEVTYNLHVMIRFDLALQMLEGKLAIRDLPEAWNERYKTDLGVTPPNVGNGVLQDMHWFSDTIGGAFQGYTLGNIMSAQFYETALKVNPEIPQEIEAGNFETLHQWFKKNIYQHGCKYTPNELIERVTGQSLSIQPYITYLKTKYSQLYQNL